MNQRLLVLLFSNMTLLGFAIFPVNADVYKHLDKSGNVTYSDFPHAVNAERVRITTDKGTAKSQVTRSGANVTEPIEEGLNSGLSTLPVQSTAIPTSSSGKASSTASTRSNASAGGGASGGGASGGGASGGGASGGGASSARGTTMPVGVKTNTQSGTSVASPTHDEDSVQDKSLPVVEQGVVATNPTTNDANKTVNPVSVKWHPGHYLLIYPHNNETSVQRALYLESVIKKDLVKKPFIKGVQKQYFWNKLEPKKDQYDFSEISRDLAMLAKVNKQLVISFQDRSFNTNEILAPDYLLMPEYGGGVYSLMTGRGFNVNYWHPAVQDRIIKLIQALGREFNHHPNLEAIHFEETSHSNRDAKWANQYSTRYYDGVIRVAQAASKAFPNTVVLQYINYADWNFDRVYNAMIDSSVAVGGPDVFANDKNLLNLSYKYISKSSNIVPIGMAVQYTNYDYDNGVGPFNPPSINSIFNFAKNELHANYIFWARRTYEDWNGTNYYQDVMDFMDTLDVNDASGGLNSRCPIKLRSCQTN